MPVKARKPRKIDRLLNRRTPEASAIPRMHWRWYHRGADLDAILSRRCGAHLPDDDAGRDYLQQIVNHWIRIPRHGITTARSNAKLRAPWISVPELDTLIEIGLESLSQPPISSAKLGKAFRATVEEVAELNLDTIAAFTATQKQERDKKTQQRRKAGVSTKRGRPRKPQAAKPAPKRRGRPKADIPTWQAAGFKSRSTYQRAKARGFDPMQRDTKNSPKNRPPSSLYKGTKGDTFSDELMCHFTIANIRKKPNRDTRARQ